MSEWGVALVVVVVFAVVVVGLAVVVRLFGVHRLTACLASDEERAVLTKNEQTTNGCLVSSESSEFVLSSTGKLAKYDTLTSDPKFPDVVDPEGVAQAGHHDDSARSSPVSVGTSSLASDLDLGHGIRRAESCDSVASDSSVLDLQPDMPKIGQVELALEYDKEVSELVISIFQCKDLPPNPYSGTLDSYIKGILLPLSDDKFQTKTVKNNTDPVFKERFLFAVEADQLFKRVLTLQVYSVDKYARQKVIGEADLRVGDVDLNMPIKVWLNLRDLDEKPTEYGDIFFSLSYLPTAERLTIVVVKARNLKWREGRDTGDPFVKVYLLQNGKKISKKKTTVKRGERNPIYNEAMIFSVPAMALPTIQLRITVAELLPDHKTPSLGHVIVGANTSGTEASHWNQMMTSLRKPTAMWHYLRK